MPSSLTTSPFTLANEQHYQAWRKQKLLNAPDYRQLNSDDLFITINNSHNPSKDELENILKACNQNSLALYRFTHPNDYTLQISRHKESVHQLATLLGLSQLNNNLCADSDSLTSITKTSHQGQHEYIPYSNKRLSWHTDGYYNTPEQQINAMLLHCAQPALEGGESLIMDHEIAYILLRDENPYFIEAFMDNNAMTIPANILEGKTIREAQTGPIFSINKEGGLHMRYSARKRNIEWQQTAPTLEAVAFLETLLESDSKHIIKYTLQAGEGLICRNVLHRRTSFVDYEETDKKRLLYRGRYFDFINKNP